MKASAYPFSASAYSEGSMKRFFGLRSQNDNKHYCDNHVPHALKNLSSYRLIDLTTFKKSAFTLAEVLITLAIIGIVAALTLPALISNYQEKSFITKAKKGHAFITNALQLYIAQNNCQNATCLFDEKKSAREVLEELMTVISGSTLCKNNESMRVCANYGIKENNPTYAVNGVYALPDTFSGPKIILPNGMTLKVVTYSACKHEMHEVIRDKYGNPTGQENVYISDNCGYIYIDTNNIAGPNQFGVDVFLYKIPSSGNLVIVTSALNNILNKNELTYTKYNIGDPVP